MAHIFLADDDPAMRQFLSTALTRAGHTVAAHGDGLSALEALQGVTAPPDLLLTDIVMPGLDGVELSCKARALFPTLKVMFITGFSLTSLEGADAHTGQTRILSKPLHISQLTAQIESLLCDAPAS